MLIGIITALSVVMLIGVLQDAFEVMLLPRRVHRRFRATRLYFTLTWAMWRSLGRRLSPGPGRERFLSVYGALSMVVLFTLWANFLITCFGILEWILQSTRASPLSEQIYMSGVTFFTLGYGDVVPHSAAARALAVIEAGTGIGLLAVVIGYLPVLYQLFSRREAHVIQLDARAGSPPTASAMLRRHAEADALDKLDELLRDWEIWASELLESHLSYPMLVYYRSQHDNQSWLTAMAAIMDTCALILVGVEDARPLQARMTFAMTRQVMVEMARTLDVTPSRYTGGDRLPQTKYEQLVADLTAAGLRWSADPATQDLLTGLRATYEPLLDGMASVLLLPVPDWIPAADAADHWQRGPRGLIASRLIEQLSRRNDNAVMVPAERRGSERLAQRLRRRLRHDQAD